MTSDAAILREALRTVAPGTPLSEDTMEMAIARSMAGSTVRAPPTVDTYTSAPEASAPILA